LLQAARRIGRFLEAGFIVGFDGQLEEDTGVFESLIELLPRLDRLLQPRLFAQDGLRPLLVVPELRLGGQVFEFGDFQSALVDVKDAPAAPASAARGCPSDLSFRESQEPCDIV